MDLAIRSISYAKRGTSSIYFASKASITPHTLYDITRGFSGPLLNEGYLYYCPSRIQVTKEAKLMDFVFRYLDYNSLVATLPTFFALDIVGTSETIQKEVVLFIYIFHVIFI
jgi:hypothetical protein